MALTKTKDARRRIKRSHDPKEYSNLWKSMAYLMGMEWNIGVRKEELWDEIPTYLDVKVPHLKASQPRRILNAAVVRQSRVMSKSPEPEFTQLDRVSAEVRKQWWLRRDDQTDCDMAEWYDEEAMGFIYGDSLGRGGVQTGAVRDRNGDRTVGLQSVPPIQVLYDEFTAHPEHSSWIAIIHYLPLDEARRIYGRKKIKKDYARPWKEDEVNEDQLVVRIIEYFDIGVLQGDPTYIVFAGDLGDDPIVHTKNIFNCLPFSWFINFIPPGYKYPIGAVHMQMQSQELIRQFYDYMFDTLDYGGGLDLFDQDAIDPDDWERYQKDSKYNKLRIRKVLQQVPWTRVPPQEVPQLLYSFFEKVDQQYQSDSGLSELDMGRVLPTGRSATEVATMDARLSMSQAWITRQATYYLRRTIERTVKVGAIVDEKPIELDIFGQNVLFNDPSNPAMDIGPWLEEESKVVIDSEAITAEDDRIKRLQRLQFLENMIGLGLVGTTVDPTWFTEQYIIAGGRDDAKLAMIKQGGVAGAEGGAPPAAVQAGQTGVPATVPIGA